MGKCAYSISFIILFLVKNRNSLSGTRFSATIKLSLDLVVILVPSAEGTPQEWYQKK